MRLQELVVIPMISEADAEAFSMNVPSSWATVVFFISFFLVVVWTMLPVTPHPLHLLLQP